MSKKINLLGYTQEQLIELFEKNGLTKLDAKRVFPWIHVKVETSFDNMSDVPKNVRAFLDENFTLDRGNCVTSLKSEDGTQKALLEFADGNRIETVLIPDEDRDTVCISTQVGCAMGCKFCHTGTQRFVRNLTSSEIMAQIMFWKDNFPVTNLVFMGMGEPLLNFENLSSALTLLLSSKAHNFSRNKITVSTCGIVGEAFLKLADFGVKLAISLHATTDEKRMQIMPIARKYFISQVLSAAKKYLKVSNTEKITFEYLLLKGINDSDEDIVELAKIARELPCKINLIIYNDWDGSLLHGSSIERANKFVRILLKHGIRTTIRKSKGQDILAACGQLRSQSINNHNNAK